jgi:hypothetical protein
LVGVDRYYNYDTAAVFNVFPAPSDVRRRAMKAPEWEKVKYIGDIQVGDRVYHVNDASLSGVVVSNCGTHAVAVNILDLTNPSEWLVLRKNSEINKGKS